MICISLPPLSDDWFSRSLPLMADLQVIGLFKDWWMLRSRFCVVTRKSPSFKVYLLDIPFGQGFKHQTSSVVEVKLINKDLNSWWIFEDWWRLMKKAIWKLLIKLLWKEALIVWLPFLLQRRKNFFSWFRNRGGDLKRSCLHVYSFGMILIQLFQFEILMNITLE